MTETHIHVETNIIEEECNDKSTTTVPTIKSTPITTKSNSNNNETSSIYNETNIIEDDHDNNINSTPFNIAGPKNSTKEERKSITMKESSKYSTWRKTSKEARRYCKSKLEDTRAVWINKDSTQRKKTKGARSYCILEDEQKQDESESGESDNDTDSGSDCPVYRRSIGASAHSVMYTTTTMMIHTYQMTRIIGL